MMFEKVWTVYELLKVIRISTSKQLHFVDVKSTSKFNVETTLDLGWHLKPFCSYLMKLEKYMNTEKATVFQRWNSVILLTLNLRQRWNNLEFGLTLKSLLFSCYDTLAPNIKEKIILWNIWAVRSKIRQPKQFKNISVVLHNLLQWTHCRGLLCKTTEIFLIHKNVFSY